MDACTSRQQVLTEDKERERARSPNRMPWRLLLGMSEWVIVVEINVGDLVGDVDGDKCGDLRGFPLEITRVTVGGENPGR